jgi:GT2 family glycosyltransferase
VKSSKLDFSHILFLNNDTEFTSSDQLINWLTWMSKRQELGAVGCTLLYPNKTIQHSCVLPGFKIAATHPLRGAPEEIAKIWAAQERPVPAVTGAALMIERQLFESIDGFDEELAHALQDVDLCLKVLKSGRQNWIVPGVTLIHHESLTRRKSHRLIEVIRFYEKWEDDLEQLTRVSPKISRWLEKVRPSWGEGKFPWRYFLHDMKS